MTSTSQLGAFPLSLTSPLSSAPTGNGGNSNDLKKPFKIRDELFASSRLAPKSQVLCHTRSLAIQVIAHEVFLLVVACAKCFAATNSEPPRIGILGGGSVGATVIMTLLAKGYSVDKVALSTRQPDRIPRCEALKAPSALPMFQLVSRYYDNARLARESDVLVLCMPPSQLKSVAIQIRHALAANANTPPLVISALCGVTHQSLSKACGSQAVVRVQPNVAEITRQWHDQQQHRQNTDGEVASDSKPKTQLSLADCLLNTVERYQHPLLLRLAAEAIGKQTKLDTVYNTLLTLRQLFYFFHDHYISAPQRDDVRGLLQAFALFCRRNWKQDTSVDTLTQICFGDQSNIVMAALGQVAVEMQQEMQDGSAKTPLMASTWSAQWEPELTELQTQLTAHALQ